MIRSTLSRLARGDVLERVRQPSFLVSLAVIVWLVHGMLPPETAGYRTFVLGDDYRPVYGSAWVGALVALLTGMYFLFVGFYLVKGSVDRDRRTGVGQILGATRVGRVRYLLAKAISNWLVFVTMTLVAVVVAAVMQQVLGEDRRLDVVALVMPFALMTLPVAAIVASAAVWFECVPFLRGGFGNIVWFFLLGVMLGSIGEDYRNTPPIADLPGAFTVASSAARSARAEYPAFHMDGRSFSMGVNINPKLRGKPAHKFPWPGLRWTPALVGSRLFWFAAALVFVFAGAVTFDRFDASRSWKRSLGLARRAPPSADDLGEAPPAAPIGLPRAATGLTTAAHGAAFAGLLLAELKLLLRGQTWWWYVGALGLALGALLSPVAHGRAAWLPVASFWPVFAWSALGHRERRWGVAPCVFSAPRPMRRLLAASWLAGVALALALGAPFAIRLALVHDTPALIGWVVGCGFAPALALALGVWTGSGKFFEVLYLFLWYVGPLHAVAALDYTGVTVARPASITAMFALVTAGLLGLAVAGRARQLRG